MAIVATNPSFMVVAPAARVAERLRSRGLAVGKVSGKSMWPLLQPGDILEIFNAREGKLRKGDIVVFARTGQLIAHRIVGRDGLAPANGLRAAVWLTKGDAALDADSPLSPDEILGKVIRIHRGQREINLESPFVKLTYWLVACVSRISPFWLPPARIIRNSLYRN